MIIRSATADDSSRNKLSQVQPKSLFRAPGNFSLVHFALNRAAAWRRQNRRRAKSAPWAACIINHRASARSHQIRTHIPFVRRLSLQGAADSSLHFFGAPPKCNASVAGKNESPLPRVYYINFTRSSVRTKDISAPEGETPVVKN